MYAELAQIREALCSEGQLFELETVVVDGIEVRAWKHAAPSLRDFWLGCAGHGDAGYMVYEDESWTYAQAQEETRRVANWLSQQGVQPGDRVAIAMRNYPEWMLAYWAITSMGAVVVGVNAWWVGEELAYGLNDCAPKAIICDRERLAVFDSIRDQVPAMTVVGVRCDDSLTDYAVSWSQLLAAEPDLPEVAIDPDSDACIFYTSGTTGRPKGAQLTHRGCTNNIMSSLFSNLSQMQAQAQAAGRELEPPPNVTLVTTPLFHVTANNVIVHTTTMVGGKLVFMYKWDAGEALKLIEREKITNLSGVPVMSRELLSHPDYDKTDTSSLKSLGGGGAPVQPDLVEKIHGKSSAAPAQGFGMTETCGLATGALGAFLVDKPGSVGPVIPVFEARIVDEQGNDLPVGEAGEVLMKSAQVIRGYLNREDATRETIVDGWLHTGDIGKFDEDGFLYIVDRAKDVVLRGGENISCAEVESTLFRFPGVAEAAVFSVPDDVLGEEVGAAIYAPDNPDLPLDELRAFCGGHLAAYKVPKYIWVLDEALPRNASGKFLKKDLRAQLSVENAG
jgi:acyl-CoA synthetase (AMP-forming)/AMP-acid ligase II